MYDSSIIEISRSALQANLNFLKKHTGPHARYCSVVKGNAYGHGLAEFVNLAVTCGVDYFAVYSADEAYQIVQHVNPVPDIYIMGNVEGEAIEWAILNGIEISISDIKRLENALDYARKNGKKALVHIEIETGMNRTGFEANELNAAAELINKNSKHIEIIGCCTHFAGAETMANNFRVSQQIERFSKLLKNAADLGINPLYKHAACSAAVMNYPATIGDMVRVGIMQYGFWPNDETFIRFIGDKEKSDKILKRLITWKAKVMNIKTVKKGDYIGYGTAYLAMKDMKLAIVPVGYAHGYSRNLSNTGKVLIRGAEARVTGIVNMNAISVDVTHIPAVEKGDEVVLIGKQKNKTISVFSFSELSSQLNYEMLTRLSSGIPRIIVD